MLKMDKHDNKYTKMEIYAVIKGYHEYKVKPEVRHTLDVCHEAENMFDKKAMAVYNDDAQSSMVGHVPAKPIKLNETLWELNQQLPTPLHVKW